MVTKILSRGSHSWGVVAPVDAMNCGSGIAVFGSCGVNVPSSRSLSYTIMVPSAWDTRNSVEEDGTQRTEVQGELDIEPLVAE